MTMFQIDYEKCDQDGICAIECPAQILEMTSKGPEPIEGAEEICIRCGHCVAICPKSAFAMDFLSPDQCMPIQKELALDADHTEHFLRSRRSIRRYKNKPVPKDLFEKALDMACCAPTGSNKQPVQWLVFDKKEDVEKVVAHVINWMKHVVKNFPEIAQMMNMERIIAHCAQGNDRICRDAPMLALVYASNEFGMGAADCHTALAYLELALPGVGLGSCWGGYVTAAASQWPDLAKMINLPENHTCHGSLMVGIPKFRYQRAPIRNTPAVTYHV